MIELMPQETTGKQTSSVKYILSLKMGILFHAFMNCIKCCLYTYLFIYRSI